MEMTLNLTSEEGLKVVEAIKDVAIENGWNAEELDECGVIEEYCHVVDVALTAMGINISIEANPTDEDEDEDEDFDEDDFDFDDDDDDDDDEESESEGIHIPWHEAERLMDFAAAIYCFCNGKKPGEVDDAFITEVNRFAREMFSKFCHSEGITHVDKEDE